MEATEVRRLGARGSASHQKRSACFFGEAKRKPVTSEDSNRRDAPASCYLRAASA
jgi:hypothetical protein